jgi:hypothetical protein
MPVRLLLHIQLLPVTIHPSLLCVLVPMSLLAFLPACKSATGRLQQPCPAKNALDCEGTEPARDGGGGGDGGKPVHDGRATGGDDSGTDSGVSDSGGTGGTGGSGATCNANGDCDGATPICNTTTQACRACTNDNQCKSIGPLCDETSGECVACVADADCKDGSKPQCTGNVCVACTSDAACTGRTGTERCDKANGSATKGACVACVGHGDCENPTPQCDTSRTCVACTGDAACVGRMDGSTAIAVCDTYAGAVAEGQCVQCTGDNEASACGNKSCKRSTGTCTTTVRGSRTPCTACEADSDCDPTAKCVVQMFDSMPFGPYCFYVDDATHDCATPSDGSRRPYSRSKAAESLDGVSASYCFPPTTCKAVEDATAMGASGGKVCANSAGCGESNVSDGLCGDTGSTLGKCTYGCDDQGASDNTDCPLSGFTTCSGAGIQICK